MSYPTMLEKYSVPPTLLTTRGQPKKRTTPQEKLIVLDPMSSPAVTKARVEDFFRLFAPRHMYGIATRSGKGPKSWTTMQSSLDIQHIVRHLLGDRMQGLRPMWFGARSFPTTMWWCIDVDADKSIQQITEKLHKGRGCRNKYEEERLYSEARRKWLSQRPFEERRSAVETAFRRMGINPNDPRHTLIQITPSGGRHYYVFLDNRYDVEQLTDLFHEAGLQHKRGEIEFFPTPKHGLRFPFGHLPDHSNNPTAWIQFIDDYRNQRVRRFSLETLYANLSEHQNRFARRAQSLKVHQPDRKSTPRHNTPIMGIPRAKQNHDECFDDLLIRGLQSRADAEALFTMGILRTGTRTKVLMLLAAHLVWFRDLAGEQAAEILTTWAMNHRHISTDIQTDLIRGTRMVPRAIRSMCRWHEEHKIHRPSLVSSTTTMKFSLLELEVLRKDLENLESDTRTAQATFLLYMLAFAKNYGRSTNDNSAWDLAPSIRQVIRRFPGCHHMNYKPRIDHATKSGILTLIKRERRSRDGSGRARTYRMTVPVGPEADQLVTYEEALRFLTAEKGLGHVVEEMARVPVCTTDSDPEVNHVRYDRTISPATNNSTALSQKDTDRNLGPTSHQCNQKSDAASGLPRQLAG